MGKYISGRRWTIAILTKIWDISWDTSEQYRSGIAHGTLHPRCLVQLQEVQKDVHDLFQGATDDLLPRDCGLFAKGLETLLQGLDIKM
jgi:hypothetical protein